MVEPCLIRDYRANLARRLPQSIVDELTDGLEQTYLRHLDTGLTPDAAAREAVAEFGEPGALADVFAAEATARRAARSLLATGPLIGGCWATLLLADHAWDWPVPALGRIAFGLLLTTVIALLTFAARTSSYRRAQRTATLACLGLIGLDGTLGAAILPSAVHGWPLVLTAAGCARIAFAARTMHRIRAY